MDITYITDNQYITITEHENNFYTMETEDWKGYGYCKKLDNQRTEYNLKTSFFKDKNFYRSKKSKFFKGDASWFCHMIEKYAHNYGQ